MIIEEVCPFCNTQGKLVFSETPSNVHYGRIDCLNCNRWVRWVRSPKNNERKRNGTSKYDIKDVLNFHGKTKEFCFFCLRTREQLGLHETMTIDHIEEIDKDGTDDLTNLQILCSACHKLKNWARLYMNWHLNGGNDDTGKA
jgi:hypothetical protein